MYFQGEEHEMTDRSIEQATIREGAQKVSAREIEKVVDKSEEIKRRFNSGGPLQRFIADGQLLIAMVKDYWSRRYRQVPVGTIGAIAFTLIYVLNPLDLIPDVLPIIGQIDDAALVAGCLLLVEHDLRSYQSWVSAQEQFPQLPQE
jgi:uncharacterized membrane protein YkvA (DUF1232 family)